ncbi:electron transfer flavoprotein subunit alpha/FixB family protein [Demequina sp. TTPB684]|uniref:electron transfer flavoprotein subunit alpha/FixB family protein n=1 Tax=unclassified Demequina TaxID=2620311 RepID=UPI001CF14069|nr:MULTISPECIES: electron transfer flavoprotein subunit alpha/FixB family protein [unclassified Demequina]MCB2413983.1 electron transfer flavoprotein subunit alpha/FixB family protein [Demequina sp. TTPB684]UPU88664.1 electron transfer flavoprotein subunit alpha/FixB family protein [Demequina sp. TMPB413]
MTDVIVAVLVEHRGTEIAQPTLEALTLARSLGAPVAVWMGEQPPPAQVERLGEYGAAEVRVLEVGEGARHPVTAAAAVGAATADASVVLMVSTFANKEIATRLALATGAGVVVDAAGAELVDGRVETTQTVFAATWKVRTRVNADKAVVTLRPNTTQAVAADAAGAAEVVSVIPLLPEVRESVVSVTPVEREEGVPLSEAAVVVSGGRGTSGDYTLVRELADVLGGAVGASRDATDEGWISHEHMVGQTGVTVTPALYVACGISGAVHHRGGMQASGTIVAVNIDPDAPIFEIADFGVVGDLNDVIPQAIAGIKAHRDA